MTTANSQVTGIAPEDRQALEKLLADFDSGWQQGQLTARERLLPPGAGRFRLAALAGLVRIDLSRQWQAGRHVRLEAYLRLYPALGTPETVAADLILAEYQACERYSPPADLTAFAERFPRRAAELRRLVVGPAVGTPDSPCRTPDDGAGPVDRHSGFGVLHSALRGEALPER